ncbi:MAG TPA: hypothetical protein VGM16_12675 [Gammaproteobacteria bacterium]|jgi:hypothetical protein
MNLRPRTFLLTALLSLLPGLAWADDLIDAKLHQTSDTQATIYLGAIAVGGQQRILEALQDIKLALEQPLSNDPKLADVVVCRITDDIGSHSKQLLVCATNRELARNKEILQTAMSNALGDTDAPSGGDNAKGSSTACATGSCYEDSLSILNQSLSNARRHFIKQQVNGASLHALLATLPYPKQVQAVPASTTVVAPAAITSHV